MLLNALRQQPRASLLVLVLLLANLLAGGWAWRHLVITAR